MRRRRAAPLRLLTKGPSPLAGAAPTMSASRVRVARKISATTDPADGRPGSEPRLIAVGERPRTNNAVQNYDAHLKATHQLSVMGVRRPLTSIAPESIQPGGSRGGRSPVGSLPSDRHDLSEASMAPTDPTATNRARMPSRRHQHRHERGDRQGHDQDGIVSTNAELNANELHHAPGRAPRGGANVAPVRRRCVQTDNHPCPGQHEPRRNLGCR